MHSFPPIFCKICSTVLNATVLWNVTHTLVIQAKKRLRNSSLNIWLLFCCLYIIYCLYLYSGDLHEQWAGIAGGHSCPIVENVPPEPTVTTPPLMKSIRLEKISPIQQIIEKGTNVFSRTGGNITPWGEGWKFSPLKEFKIYAAVQHTKPQQNLTIQTLQTTNPLFQLWSNATNNLVFDFVRRFVWQIFAAIRISGSSNLPGWRLLGP